MNIDYDMVCDLDEESMNKIDIENIKNNLALDMFIYKACYYNNKFLMLRIAKKTNNFIKVLQFYIRYIAIVKPEIFSYIYKDKSCNITDEEKMILLSEKNLDISIIQIIQSE